MLACVYGLSRLSLLTPSRLLVFRRYSVGYVFTDGIKAAELKAVISECILLIESAGLEVAYTVCDGAAENRAWMELMADTDLALKVAAGVT